MKRSIVARRFPHPERILATCGPRWLHGCRVGGRLNTQRTAIAAGLGLAASLACVPDLDSLSDETTSNGAGGDAGAIGVDPPGASGNGGGSSGDGSGGTSGASGAGGGAGSAGTAGAGGSAQPAPEVRFDFEEAGVSGLEGWVAVGDQRPPDVQDTVEQSTEAAHSGSGALRAVFDGQATVPDAGEPNPWYGVYRVGTVPDGYELGLWMMATMPGVTAEIYAQTTQAYLWNVLGSTSLPVGEWRKISVITPVEVMQWGIKLQSPFAAEGYVYVDEVTW